MSLPKLELSDAIQSLKQISSFGSGPQPIQQVMLKTIENVENQFSDSYSAELEYWLGIAWCNYTSWFIRGDDRKPCLEKAVVHLERAYVVEKGSRGTEWKRYASELGVLLVEEALIRDLERGISLLEKVFRSTRGYDPFLCTYAEALYKSGNFQKAAVVATELHQRAKKSREWRDSVPPAPMRIAAKAYRADIKQLKKDGKIEEAYVVSVQLLQTEFATDNDRQLHEKLSALAGKT